MRRALHPFIFIAALVALLLTTTRSAQATLVGLYRFEGNTLDSSGNGNHGVVQNQTGSVFGANTPLLNSGGQSLFLDSANEHVLVPHSASLNITSQMTISAWINPGALGAFEGVIAKNPSNGSASNHAGNYELRTKNDRSAEFLYQKGGVNDTTTLSSGANRFVPNSWTHIAVTADGANTQFFVDGNLVSTVAMPAGFGATNTNPLYIGARADLFTDFAGRMDDVAIFNSVLTQAEINTIKLGDFSAFGVGSPSNLVEIPIFNTGVAANDAVLAPGAADPHWSITASHAGAFGPAVVQSNNSAWLVNDAVGTLDGSSWISTVSSGGTNIAPGGYTFEQTFDLSGLNPDNAKLIFELASDNSITDILLNGVSTGLTSAGFSTFNGPFTIDSGFQDGLNTLTIQVFNAGTAVNPGGLRVNFLQAVSTVVPEPTVAVLALGSLGALMLRRRRSVA